MDLDGDDHEDHGDGAPDGKQGCQPAEPFAEGNMGHGAGSHHFPAGGGEHVRKGIAHLESQDRGLPGDPNQVGQRCEQGHGDGRLAAAGRHQHIEQILDDEHAAGTESGRQPVQQAGHIMDHRIHDMGVLHDQHCRVAHADDQVGKQHVAAAGEERIGNLAGREAPDDAGKNTADQEEPGHFIDVEVEFQDSHHHGGNGQHEQHQHQFVPDGDHRGLLDLQVAVVEPVLLPYGAQFRIFPDYIGIPHDVGNGHDVHDHEHHRPEPHAGKHGQAADALGHSDGEGVRHGAGVAHRCGAEHNGDGRQGVEAHSHRNPDDKRRESQEFFKAPGKGGQKAEQEHTDRDHQQFPALHPLHYIGQARIDGTGGIHDGEHAADDEKERNDFRYVLESQGQGLEQIKKTDGLLLDIVERGGIHHFLVQCGIQHTAVFPGRYKIRSQESKDHDDSQEDHGIQRMEFEFTFLLFRHLIPLLYRSLLLRCSRPPG